MVINKKIMRTMMESKAQYVGSLLLIIISCLLYTMFNQLSSNMANLTSSFEKNYVQEDANFIADKKISNISAIEKKFNMKLEETRVIDYEVSKDKTLRVFSENTKVNIPALIEGEKLKGQDILFDPGYAKANNLKIGDRIKIYDRQFKIAGFMSLPNYIYPIKSEGDILNDPNSFGIAVITKGDFTKINEGNSLYSIKFNGDEKDLLSKIDQLKEYLKSENIVILKWTNISENPRVTFLTAKLTSIDKMSSVLPVTILLLTCILTGVVMWRMLKREFMIIGTLYALGYRKREILRHYLMYPISIALIGGIIGTILGGFTLRPMLNMMVSYFNMPVDIVIFNTKYVVISILLPLILLTLSGYFVVNKALKYSPVELMRGGKEKGKVGFIERSLKLDKFKFTTKFKIREQLRSIPRSAFLLLGVVLATMLLLMGFASMSSMNYLMKDTYGSTLKYKHQYVFNSIQKGAPSKGEAFSETLFTLKSDSKTHFAVFGVNPDTKYIAIKDKSGSKMRIDKVIITRPLADNLQVKPGDIIQAINELDSRRYNVKVDGIAETYAGAYVYMPLAKFNEMLHFPADSYAGLWSNDKLNIPESSLLSSLTIDDFKKAFDAMMGPIRSYIGTIAFISFIIGLIVIYVVTSMIIEENKESISLMKVFGYRKREVYSLILNSSSFIIILGYIIGVPLLLVSLSALYSSVTKSMNITFPITIDYNYIIIGFIIIYFTFELSKAFSKRKINRISMTEALKAGE